MIRKGNQWADGKLRDLAPLLRWFRGLMPEFEGIKSDDLVIRQEVNLDGPRLLLMEAGQTDRFWIDPMRDYIIVRWQGVHPKLGYVYAQADITYQRDRAIRWVPQKWKVATFDRHNNVSEQFDASIFEYEINPAVDQQAFRLDFAPGTLVSDATRRSYGVADATGGVRHISRQEYQALKAQSSSKRTSFLLVLTGVITCTVIVLLCWSAARAKLKTRAM